VRALPCRRGTRPPRGAAALRAVDGALDLKVAL
jgi:hypothetical protein